MTDSERPSPLILYVDDKKANRVVFEQALGTLFAVRCVADAETALEVMAEAGVAVLVTDMRMPVMSGEELLRVVKERYPQAIRIVITAYSDVEPILRAINEGLVARYIIKPWVHTELVQVLQWAVEAWTFGRDSTELQRRLLETERLASLGHIAAAAAHDLSQPAQTLVFNTEQLVDLSRAVPALRQALIGGYVSGSDHKLMTELIDLLPTMATDLRDHAVLVKGVLDGLKQYTHTRLATNTPSTPIDPLPIVRHAMSVCKDIALKARTEVRYEGPPELPRVKIPATEFTQVLVNLVANAAEAVLARGTPYGRVAIVARADNGQLEVQVQDDGVGIPADVLARLGTPFFTTRVGGTGLGLSQCQRLIGAAGGRLRIDSTEGVGTTVTITLPLAA